MNLRSWLRKAPAPHSLRVHGADGAPVELAIQHDDPRKWARVIESLDAMAPIKLEALDPKGKVLRVTLCNDPQGDEPEESKGPPQGGSRLAELAFHLNAAADNGAKHVREASKDAMAAMATITQLAVSSVKDATTAIDRLTRRLERAEAALQQGQAGDGAPDVPSMLLQGMMMRQLGPAAALLQPRGAGVASPGAPAQEGGMLDGLGELSEDEAGELGSFFAKMMARRQAKAPNPQPPPTNGAGS